MRTNAFLCLLLLLTFILPHNTLAKIQLPALVGSHMVLQQNSDVKIWGKANPGETITFTAGWTDEKHTATTAPDSTWSFVIITPNAGGPYFVTIQGENTIELTDVYIGEVWLCSGQSNMEKPIGERHGQRPTFNHKKEIKNANYPRIKLFKVPKRKSLKELNDIKSSWQSCTPESVEELKFSAAGYFFGREIHKKLEVPIGLIDATWGGSRIELWTPADAFGMVDGLDSLAAAAQIPGKKAEGLAPSIFYNAMVAPLTHYSIKGAIWYQGESNLMDINDGLRYENKQKAMIKGWRSAWKNSEMPFYYVQIAPYRYYTDRQKRVNSPNELPLLWEAQTRGLQIPNTGMVVTTDLVDDLSDIHPRNKLDVGKRLANLALDKTYQVKGIKSESPVFDNAKFKKNKVILAFKNTYGSLIAKNNTAPTCFTIAGHDRKFVKAKAEIKGDKVIVYNEQLNNPAAVRFAWDEEAQPNLFNAAGLPVIPFRTDNWAMPITDDSSKVSFLFGKKRGNIGQYPIHENIEYTNSRGFGFDFNNKGKVSIIEGEQGYCTADVPFYFSVKKPEGNYQVEITFGNPDKISKTSVKAEARRLMLKNIEVQKSETLTRNFMVNVRSPKIDQNTSINLKTRETNYMNWDNRLTLEFSGKNVAIQKISIKPVEDIKTIFLAGNSTVTDQDCAPWASWGQMITPYFNNEVVVANYAESGSSLAAFKGRRRLDKIESVMRPGDYLFIEFGHNDQKRKGEGIGPWQSFTGLLIEYVNRARAKGGIPVLVTPTQRRSFNNKGEIEYTHGDYPAAMRKVAEKYNVPLIDLNEMTKTLYETWGIETSKKAFVQYPANTFPGQDKELSDNTHFNPFGAHEIAKCVLKGISESSIDLKNHIVGFDPDYHPQKPSMSDEWDVPMSPRFESIKPDGN